MQPSALGVLLAGTAFAAAGEDAYQMAEGTESYADVYDMADLFTDEEEKQLSEQAQVLSDTMKMEAVIVTTEENSDSAQVFADGFYMEGGFGTGSDHSGTCFSSIWITGNSTIHKRTDDPLHDGQPHQ